MPRAKQVTGESLWENEEYAINQYELGKDKSKSFKTPEELIADLHKSK